MTYEEYLLSNTDLRGYVVSDTVKKELREYIEQKAYSSRFISPYHTGRNGRAFDVDDVISFVLFSDFSSTVLIEMTNNRYLLMTPRLVDYICSSECSLDGELILDQDAVEFARLVDRAGQYNKNFKQDIDYRLNNYPNNYKYYSAVSYHDKMDYMKERNAGYDARVKAKQEQAEQLDLFNTSNNDDQVICINNPELEAVARYYRKKDDIMGLHAVFTERLDNEELRKYNVTVEDIFSQHNIKWISDITQAGNRYSKIMEFSVMSDRLAIHLMSKLKDHNQLLQLKNSFDVITRSVKNFTTYMLMRRESIDLLDSRNSFDMYESYLNYFLVIELSHAYENKPVEDQNMFEFSQLVRIIMDKGIIGALTDEYFSKILLDISTDFFIKH